MTPNQNITLFKIGHPKHKEAAAQALIKDKSKEGRQGRRDVARYGNDSHRNKLVNDEDSWVKWNVAQYGNDSHRNKLVNDEDSWVKRAVAEHGNLNHANILKNDKDEFVAKAARKRIKELTK